jgi:serine/threonine-protein kinase
MIGQTISHYRVVSKLGQGGMGVVYLAEDTLLGRQVAIKTIVDANSDRPRYRSRFLREARAVSTLSHPNIATIYDFGETSDGLPYIVMELIKETLSDLILKSKLSLRRSLEIAIRCCCGTGQAHHHVALAKSHQTSLSMNAAVKCSTLARRQFENLSTFPSEANTCPTETLEGAVVGTPMYTSPEQALGHRIA